MNVSAALAAGQYLALWGESGAGQPKAKWIFTVTKAQPRVTGLFRALARDLVWLRVHSTSGSRVTQPNADGLYVKGAEATLTAMPDPSHQSWKPRLISATGPKPSASPARATAPRSR